MQILYTTRGGDRPKRDASEDQPRIVCLTDTCQHFGAAILLLLLSAETMQICVKPRWQWQSHVNFLTTTNEDQRWLIYFICIT